MRLKELEIQGFKSFPDKTRITIGEGITGVVGPNGSGKSNISDSIRWVLGETSSKQLRGAGKMEDVIFGGTQTRGAMGYAAVSLTIDNSDHGLEMDADEVTIGRRYYRSGESEYTINGQSVRLKDVYELLLDTGIDMEWLFANLYSVEYNSLKFKAYVYENMRRTENGVAYFSVSKDVQTQFGLSYEQASAAISYLEGIRGYLCWLAFIESPDGSTRVRLRSRFLTINQVAEKYHGGGHACASGATVYSTDEAAALIADADEAVREYKAAHENWL